MFEEFIDRGCQIGLLVSPPQSPLLAAKKHIGALDVDQQEATLSQARSLFTDFMGFRPTLLRTGLHSGTLSFFQTCQKYNFTHTSIRLPGAQLSQIGTVWPEQDASIASFHGVIDVPVTTDPAHRLFNRFPLYLSAEISENGRHQELMHTGSQNGHVCITASNVAAYWNHSEPATQNLYSMLTWLSDTETYESRPLHMMHTHA
ncbi:MAG: hypothetical protein FJ040_10840 [Chloroflexi bacterium]|nr:hypothetical protein [Chloroflexota bacterium]